MEIRRYKAGDYIPLGDLLRAHSNLVRCLETGSTFLCNEEELLESERLMRATLNCYSQQIPDLPGEIVILFESTEGESEAPAATVLDTSCSCGCSKPGMHHDYGCPMRR